MKTFAKSMARIRAAERADVRVLPAAMVVAGVLFALKIGGLAFDASAMTQDAAEADEPGPSAESLTDDPTASFTEALAIPNVGPAGANTVHETVNELSPELAGVGVTPAQMDVLTSLSDRRDALDARQRQLELRANILAATEKRVDEKINELQSIQTQIEMLLDQTDAENAAQLDTLVRVYSAMKPRDAARIFGDLDADVRISVAGKLKPDIMAGIMAALPSDIAQDLTVSLVNRFKPPEAATAPVPAPMPAQVPLAPPTDSAAQANDAPLMDSPFTAPAESDPEQQTGIGG